MAAVRLDERRVQALKPRRSAYDVRDRELKGFGVRVLPSGAKRYFVHSQHNGHRVLENRRSCRVHRRRRGPEPGQDVGGLDPGREPTQKLPREETSYSRPSPMKCSGDTPETGSPPRSRSTAATTGTQILPWFEGRPIASITAHDVQGWFASLHETPVAADRSAPILSVIMRQAEVYGYRPEGSNPCVGIKRYRRQGRERFLSAAEFRRLGEVLARHEPDRPQLVAIIRLLLLTGCRRSEIVTLKWSFYREGKLFLPDSKVGPRTVWLSSAARAILDGVPRKSAWIFPSPLTDSCLHQRCVSTNFWYSPEGRSRPVRCSPSRSSPLLRQHGAWRRARRY